MSAVGAPSKVACVPPAVCRLPPGGFTLIEVLVALALVSTIATMVYGSYTAACRSLDLYGRRQVCTERACLVLRLLGRQIRCARAPSSRTISTPQSPPRGPEGVFHGQSRAGGTILSFVTTGGPSPGPQGATALSRIRYRYEPANETLSICRDPYWGRTDTGGGTESWQPLLRGVRRIDLQFLRGGQWRAEWTGRDSEKLPQAVRIAFTLIDENSRPHEFGTTVPIVCRKVLQNQSLVAGAGKP